TAAAPGVALSPIALKRAGAHKVGATVPGRHRGGHATATTPTGPNGSTTASPAPGHVPASHQSSPTGNPPTEHGGDGGSSQGTSGNRDPEPAHTSNDGTSSDDTKAAPDHSHHAPSHDDASDPSPVPDSHGDDHPEPDSKPTARRRPSRLLTHPRDFSRASA
ncbi:MAG: hypothetical protein QOJ12_1837, partial [Thermoleophilales bacterium]|nr:hypothetical protein [Thermoleophilales bacterium]